jgi:histidyl-tRNA synthetase
VMEAIGLGGEENAGRRLTVLRAIDKLDRLGSDGVRQLLGPGRKDESGDFTKGAELAPSAIDLVLGFLSADLGTYEGRTAFLDVLTGIEDPTLSRSSWESISADHPVIYAGVNALDEIEKLSRSAGYEADRIQIDPSVVRGLEYYTGPVFEAQLTFEVPNEKGEPVVFGSVGGGGRYDGLVGRFRGEEVPATGFSVGVSRLASALKAIGKLGDEGAHGPVVVTVMDKNKLPEYQKIVADLRNAGVVAELYLGSSGMKAQLKYADRRNSPCAIIAGSQEFDAGKLQIKDLVAGKAQASSTADNAAWREERPGQFEVDAGDVVAKVKELLAKQRQD